jgi:hypothetical protein
MWCIDRYVLDWGGREVVKCKGGVGLGGWKGDYTRGGWGWGGGWEGGGEM